MNASSGGGVGFAPLAPAEGKCTISLYGPGTPRGGPAPGFEPGSVDLPVPRSSIALQETSFRFPYGRQKGWLRDVGGHGSQSVRARQTNVLEVKSYRDGSPRDWFADRSASATRRALLLSRPADDEGPAAGSMRAHCQTSAPRAVVSSPRRLPRVGTPPPGACLPPPMRGSVEPGSSVGGRQPAADQRRIESMGGSLKGYGS